MMPLPMIGRAEELAELVHTWSRVTTGGPGPAGVRTAVLTGGAGCGKSLLVNTALDTFDPPPSRVLFGRARIHSPAPYDWLAAALSAHRTADLPVPDDALAWLGQHPGPPARRYAPGALLRLAVRTVRALVGHGPAVIVAEDLHALDPASLNLLGELAAAPGLPALLVVTSRPAQEGVSPHLAARTLAQLAGAPGAVRQHLTNLDGAGVLALLSQVYPTPIPDEVARVVFERTGGNPYQLAELLAVGRGAAPDALADRARELAGLTGHAPDPIGRAGDRTYGPAGGPGAGRATTRPAGATTGPAGGTTGGAAGGTGDDTAGAPRPDPPADLTAREIEVLSCLAAGMSNKQVASALGISIRTVTVHVSNLLRKTRSASRTEAALWAIRHRLVSP